MNHAVNSEKQKVKFRAVTKSVPPAANDIKVDAIRSLSTLHSTQVREGPVKDQAASAPDLPAHP